MSEHGDVQKRIESIEGLVREIEGVSDPSARSLSRRLVQSLMDLHGAGIERMLAIVHDTGEPGQQIIDEMGRDEVVRSLLLLYGLHPLGLEERVLDALEKSRPYLRAHGGSVELIGISDAGAVTVRLGASSHGCASSATTLQSTVEQAIYDGAPDVTAIVVEGAPQQPPASFVPVSILQGNGNAQRHGQPQELPAAQRGPT